MTRDTTIRYRPDGSIDTDHYIRVGRRLRSERAHDLLGGGAHPEERAHRRPHARFRLF